MIAWDQRPSPVLALTAGNSGRVEKILFLSVVGFCCLNESDSVNADADLVEGAPESFVKGVRYIYVHPKCSKTYYLCKKYAS